MACCAIAPANRRHRGVVAGGLRRRHRDYTTWAPTTACACLRRDEQAGTVRLRAVDHQRMANLRDDLSRGDYTHKFFVDGPVRGDQSLKLTPGKNLLVGALGKEWAWPVRTERHTNPSTFDGTGVKWERAQTRATTWAWSPGRGLAR